MKKISEIDKDLRPREKLQRRGAASLSDYELIMAIIGSGNLTASVTEIARDVNKLLREKLGGLEYGDLLKVNGLGAAKATQLMASYELWRRRFEVSDQPVITSLADAAKQFDDIRNRKQEHVVALSLDGAGRLINKRLVSIGTINASMAHPREVYADVIADRATTVLIAHNHPSGSLEPSDNDIIATRRLKDSAELLGILFWDHLIITKDSYASILGSDKWLMIS